MRDFYAEVYGREIEIENSDPDVNGGDNFVIFSPMEGIRITVYEADTTNEIELFNTRTGVGAKANPFITGADGMAEFWAEYGSCDILVEDTEVPERIGDKIVGWNSRPSGDDSLPVDAIDGLIPGDKIEDIDVDSLTSLVQSMMFTAGDLKVSARSAPETGWFLCDGAVKSQVTEADLFGVIGTEFNTGGEGGGNFRLPDYRGRTIVGVDGSAGRLSANDSLGDVGGEEKHTLTEEELASHNHTSGSRTTGGGGTTVGTGIPPHNNIGVSPILGVQGSDAGGDDPHNNMQPYQVGNVFIKA